MLTIGYGDITPVLLINNIFLGQSIRTGSCDILCCCFIGRFCLYHEQYRQYYQCHLIPEEGSTTKNAIHESLFIGNGYQQGTSIQNLEVH